MNRPRRLSFATAAFIAFPATVGVAAETSDPSVKAATPRIQCVVKDWRDVRTEIAVPGQMTFSASAAPFRVQCASGEATMPEVSLRPTPDGLPVTVDINRVVLATLDPTAMNRDGRITAFTASFRPSKFASPTAVDTWFKERQAKIDQTYSAQFIALDQADVPCKFNAACNDKIESLDAQKEAALQGLARTKGSIDKQFAPPAPEPAAPPAGAVAPPQTLAQADTPPPEREYAAQPICTVEKRRGNRTVVAAPGRVQIYWREMPVSVTCEIPGKKSLEQTIRMPRDRWLPFTMVIDDMVIASLDPKAGYRFRKPARMTLSLYPKAFASAADKDRWYRERQRKIEEGYKARELDIEQRGVDCKFDATCYDELEALERTKKRWLSELDRLSAATSILPPVVTQKKPARVEIKDGGKKVCLVKSGDGTWKSRPCEVPAAEIRRITVNGKEECIARVDATTWESVRCP